MTQETDDRRDPVTPSQQEEAIPFWRVMLSVLQASFGVQKQSNKERDFEKGRLMPFIVAALLFTAVFILALVGIVSLVLP